jgi:hypothetical protein
VPDFRIRIPPSTHIAGDNQEMLEQIFLPVDFSPSCIALATNPSTIPSNG